MSNENTVEEAKNNVDAAMQAQKEANASLKEAKKNLKNAKAYAKNPPEGEEEKAAELVTGWEEAVNANTESAEAAKAAVAEAREALKEAKAAAAEADREPRVEQNGIVQPRETSASGKAWAVFDRATQERGSTCAIADVLEEVVGLGLSEGSARSAYSHWRRFNNVPAGRIASLRAPAADVEKLTARLEKLRGQHEKAAERVGKLDAQIAEIEEVLNAAAAA